MKHNLQMIYGFGIQDNMSFVIILQQYLLKLVLSYQMKQHDEKVGKKQLCLQDFEIEYKLGEGAYGYVFLASRNNQEFAIKEMNKHKLKRQHREYIPLIQKEILRAINHPGIIKSFCAFQNTNYLYLVMEYCPESEFQSIIKNNLLTEPSRRFYIAQLVNVIQYLHSHGIIHRDLKPSNLLLSKDRHLKLIDFGTAEITHSDLVSQNFKDKINQMKTKKKEQGQQFPSEKIILKKKSTFVGTSEFLPPELIEKNECVPASDLWALGCIIYYLYYGHGPFMQTNQLDAYHSIQNSQPQYPSNQYIPLEALDLMKKLLVKQPNQRLGSCSSQDLSFDSLKNHSFFEGTDFNGIFESPPPFISTPETQIQQKFMQLKLQANLSYKQPSFENILQKLLVKIDENDEGIYLCHFKKVLCLEEFQMQGISGDLIVYKLQKDQYNNVAHLLSDTKFSIGIQQDRRLIYNSRDSKAICQLLNEYYSSIIQKSQETKTNDTNQ